MSELTRTELKTIRLNALLDSCQQQVLAQIIGPLGLTPAMFNDQVGGNVTTQHNFEQGITATKQDKDSHQQWQQAQQDYQRRAYDADLKKKRKALFKTEDEIHCCYTDKILPRNGQTHLDHVVAANKIETDSRSHLFQTTEQRVAMANQEVNLKPAGASINMSMREHDKQQWAQRQRKADPGKTNAESFGVDMDLLNHTVDTAKRKIERDLMVAQLKKQGQELAVTGTKEAAMNGLKQGLGLLLHEFVNALFTEAKQLFTQTSNDSLIERLLAAFKRIFNRLKTKFKDALKAAFSGGIQAFFSNLLTFIINTVVTTSSKVVTMLREGMASLWQAIKLLIWPPENMPAVEIARAVSQIIASLITTSLGLIFEESIKAFLLTIPVLTPIAGILSTAFTALLTGIATALIVYGIDRLFDNFARLGTEQLAAQNLQLAAGQQQINQLCDLVEQQYYQSRLYADLENSYRIMAFNLNDAIQHQQHTMAHSTAILNSQQSLITRTQTQIERRQLLAQRLARLK
ncbi:hypothetical protein [Shewanella marina]|uniref:hypothetical protein n=1 Tax=Shewanella marina TaxID=487319 RepID=UPI00046EDCBC|nr:hypothetical protein [Shewanella marina]